MTYINKITQFSRCLLIVLQMASCTKFVEVPPPNNQVIAAQVFTDSKKATEAVTAIYGYMINAAPAYSNHLTTVYAGIASDELSRFNPATFFQEFMSNAITPANPQVKNLWTGLYKSIYNANACMEGLDKATNLDPELIKQLKAECLFIRSLANFYLVNLFGDSPLLLTTDFANAKTAARSPEQEIWIRIEADLLEAKANLAANDQLAEKVRPGQMAAMALLARVYLYTRQWTKAEETATQIINTGSYLPLQEPATVFLKNSKEAIWQLMPNSGILQETRQMRPQGTNPQTIITNQQLAAFETNDKRKKAWIDSINHSSGKYFFPAKYRNTTTTITEYYMVLRAAEQILIAAEAKAQQNKLAEAVTDVNLIRQRAGLSPLSTLLSKNELLLAIEQERRIEFFAEWGHRWLDLKRTNRINDVLTTNKPGWQPYAALLPIPLDQLLANPALTQNSGY